MGVNEFNNKIRHIAANHPEIFNGKAPIESYYAIDKDRATERYSISIFDSLPTDINEKIQDAFREYLA
jgi:hypothetical protein